MLWLVLQVKVLATDHGTPARTDEATVEVTIVRDRGELRFSTTMYTVTVSENKEVNSDVTRVTAAPSVCVVFVSLYV